MANNFDWLRLPNPMQGVVDIGDDEQAEEVQVSEGPESAAQGPISKGAITSAAQALDRTNPEDATIDFELPELNDAIDQQADLMLERQEAESAAIEKRLLLTTDAVQQSDDIYTEAFEQRRKATEQQLGLLMGVDSQLAKAQEAIALSDSQNPLDRLQLYLLQQSDPSYTREGNLARIEYLRTASETVADRSVIQQSGYQDQLDEMSRQIEMSMMTDDNMVTLLKTQEAQGRERLEAAKEAMATRAAVLQNEKTIQTLTVESIPDVATVEAALKDARSNGGKTVVNGVETNQALLQERLDVLKARDVINKQNEVNGKFLTLNSMSMPQIEGLEREALGSKDGMATMLDGNRIPLAYIQGRKSELLIQETSDMSQLQTQNGIRKVLIMDLQEQAMANLSVTELNDAITKNGMTDKFPGMKFDVNALKAMRDVRGEAEAIAFQNQAADLNMRDPAAMSLQFQSFVESLNATPGSDLHKAIEASKGIVVTQFGMISDNPTPINKALGATVLEGQTNHINDLIDAEASKLSMGNKNLELGYQYFLRGRPIPVDVIEKSMYEQVTSKKYAGSWVGSTAYGTYLNEYNQQLGILMDMDSMNGSPSSSAATDAQKAQAAIMAMDAMKRSIAAPLTDEILAFQTTDKENPLVTFGGVTGIQFLDMQRKAENEAVVAFMQEEQLDPAAMANISDSQRSSLDQLKAARVIQALETHKPGLGKMYVDWWNSDKRVETLANYVNMKTGMADTLPSMAELSAVMPDIAPAWDQYAHVLNQGHQLLFARDLEEQHLNVVAFGNDQTAKQVFLLEHTEGLTNIEKQTAMSTIIQPLIVDAQTQNLNAQDATKYIEGQLRTLQPTDPNTRALLKKMMTSRDGALKITDDFLQLQINSGGFLTGRTGIPDAQMKGIRWWTEMQPGT